MIKFLKLFFFISLLFKSQILYSSNIATIDINKILENSNDFNNYINLLNNTKINEEKILNKKENKLFIKKNEIEELKVLLDSDAFEIIVNKYNEDLINFQNEINKFNEFINYNIENAKLVIIDNIYLILKEISIINNIDIVFTQNNYFFINEKIDLTNDVIFKLNNKKIELIIKDQLK